MQALKYLKIGTCPASQKLLAHMEKMLIYIGNHPKFHCVNTSGRVDFSRPVMVIFGPQKFRMAPKKSEGGQTWPSKVLTMGITLSLHGRMY